VLKIEKLGVQIEGKKVLAGLDLEIKEGEVMAVMGPNGSGKSTLAYTLAGKYQNTGKIFWDKKDISGLKPEERARLGIFLANQAPVAIPGLSVNRLLWSLYKTRIQYQVLSIKNKEDMNIMKFRGWVEKKAEGLGIGEELLKRGLNDGFSGGERKKMEMLQMLVLEPKLVILDEIDSGLDVDALKRVTQVVADEVKNRKMAVLVITHYSRILKYLKPDRVAILKEGKIERMGGWELVEEIERDGYEK
jgi:Fe-S cluster assembly ATP-binding protein